MKAFPVVPFDDRLRAYQRESILSVHAHLAEGATRVLGVAATGTGKSAMLASLARGLGHRRTLVLVHTEELVEQLSDAFATWWPDAPVGRIDASRHDTGQRVIVAMVQSLVRRLDRAPANVELITLDDARQVVTEARRIGAVVFFKQVGGRTPTAGGDQLDGITIKEFPRENRIRP